jgi:hypothetical protein
MALLASREGRDFLPLSPGLSPFRAGTHNGAEFFRQPLGRLITPAGKFRNGGAIVAVSGSLAGGFVTKWRPVAGLVAGGVRYIGKRIVPSATVDLACGNKFVSVGPAGNELRTPCPFRNQQFRNKALAGS